MVNENVMWSFFYVLIEVEVKILRRKLFIIWKGVFGMFFIFSRDWVFNYKILSYNDIRVVNIS